MSDEYVLITTLSHFKLKYAIPREDFEALGFTEPLDQQKLIDLVNQGKVREFSQTHLGEVVGDVSVYAEDDMLTIFDTDNNYLSGWSKDKKISFMRNWKEDEY
jgi:hypothetical protein